VNRPVRRPAALAAGLAVIALAAAAVGALPGGLELVVAPVRGGPPLLAAPLEVGEPFTLYYHHSVNGLPIWEVHTAGPQGRIFIEEERFVSFNAGMGHLRGRGRHILRDGLQVITDMHWPVGRMVVRVGGPAVGHTILWRGTRTNLSELLPGRAVEVSARPVSLARRLWRRLFPPSRIGRRGAGGE
jgi:hypothetical protein